MEKISTVELVLLCPMVKALHEKMSQAGEPLAPLFKDLYDKLSKELQARPMDSFLNALKTIKTIEPRTDSGNMSEFIEMLEFFNRMGIKYGAKV